MSYVAWGNYFFAIFCVITGLVLCFFEGRIWIFWYSLGSLSFIWWLKQFIWKVKEEEVKEDVWVQQ